MGLFSLGAKLIYSGGKAAYNSHQKTQTRQAAIQYAWSLIVYYSGLYRADPRADNGLASLPLNADDLHRDIHGLYRAKIARTRGDAGTAIAEFQRLVAGYIDILPQSEQQRIYTDITTCQHCMPPETLVLRYEQHVDWMMNLMLPGQSQQWLVEQNVPPPQAGNAESQPQQHP